MFYDKSNHNDNDNDNDSNNGKKSKRNCHGFCNKSGGTSTLGCL